MAALRSCPTCGVHIRDGACLCPFCGARSCASAPGGVTRAALVLSLALVACGPIGGQPKYGVALTDDDGDGYFAEEDDCDDGDDSVHPDATETPGDGVDSNCNDDDDT